MPLKSLLPVREPREPYSALTSLPDLPHPAVLPGSLRATAASLAVAVAAVVLVAAILGALAWATGLAGSAPPVPRSPFGTGLQEGGTPGNALAAWVLAVQSAFSRQLVGAVREFSANGTAGWALMGVGFAYGIFHAAGPGHGKAVISAWIMAQDKALRRGLGLSFAAAGLQALVAIALVATLAGLLHVTAARMSRVAGVVETTSFAAVAIVGAMLLWRKAGRFAGRVGISGAPPAQECSPDCGHVHAVGPDDGAAGWRDAAGVVIAAGIRPCSGAIILLVFALTQGVFAAGIAATLTMALGTALTTGALACLSVFAKASALRLASGRGQGAELAVLGLEVLAAAFVVVLGLALMAGMAPVVGLA